MESLMDKQVSSDEITPSVNQMVLVQKVFARILTALPCKGQREETIIDSRTKIETQTPHFAAKWSARIRAKKMRMLGL